MRSNSEEAGEAAGLCVSAYCVDAMAPVVVSPANSGAHLSFLLMIAFSFDPHKMPVTIKRRNCTVVVDMATYVVPANASSKNKTLSGQGTNKCG